MAPYVWTAAPDCHEQINGGPRRNHTLRTIAAAANMRKLLFSLLISTVIVPVSFGQDPDCPPEYGRTRNTLVLWLTSTSDAIKGARAAVGVPGTGDTDIRVLAGPADAFLCRHLATKLSASRAATHEGVAPRYHITYFEAGGWYFAVRAVAPHPDPSYVASGTSIIMVYDEALNYRRSFAF